MTYKEILLSYKNALKERRDSYKCFTDVVYITVTTGTGENQTTTYVPTTNDGYNLITKWMNRLINEESYPTYDRIPKFIKPTVLHPDSHSFNLYMYYTIMSLFIQLEAKPYEDNNYECVMYEDYTERAEDVNYNLINGYADGSKSLEDYNPSTQEFFKRAEYWNVRGHLYELLVGANEGRFIQTKKYLVDELCSFLDNEEKRYQNSSLTTTQSTTDSDGTSTCPITKAEKYWTTIDERINDLTYKINTTLMEIYNDIKYFHTTLISLVYDYLRLYESATEYTSKGETFISALQKTSTEPYKSLGDSFAKVGVEGFKLYSGGLSKAYEYFVKATNRRDASKYKNTDDNNIYLRKYYQHEVLTDYQFFSKSEEFLNDVKALRKKLDI